MSIFSQAETDILADVAGFYQEVSVSAEGRYQSIGAPQRVLDTRPLSGPLNYSGDKPVAGQTVTFPVAGRAGVPATGAASVMLNVTATEATDRGFVTVFPGGEPLPWASNVNVQYAGETRADQAVAPLGADGTVSIYTQRGTHLVVDVAGWFTGPTAPEDVVGLFRPVSPYRALDTRNRGGLVPPGATATVDAAVVPPGLVPDTGVSAVVANVTATEALDRGFITAYPSGDPLPWASNLNVDRPGEDIANHATVGVDPGTTFTRYTQSGTQLVADLFGWYVG